jgi:hypothetical protein
MGTTPERAERAARRRAEVLRMRVAGLNFQQIGERLDPPVSRAMANKLYKVALQEITREPSDEARQLELERIDDMIVCAREVLGRTHYVVQAGKVVTHNGRELVDDGPVLAVLDRLIRLSETKRRLLGLDAPTRTEHKVTTVDQVDAEIAELEAELARRQSTNPAGSADELGGAD